MDSIPKRFNPSSGPANDSSKRRNSVGSFSKMRSKLLASFFSFFLVVTCSLKNIATAGAHQPYSSQSKLTSKKLSKSQIVDAVNHGTTESESRSDNKLTRKVAVEFIVAKNDPVGAAAKKIERKSATLAKQINRKSREVEKALSNDLSEFEKEAGQEVKQSWESLTGSMKGGAQLTYKKRKLLECTVSHQHTPLHDFRCKT